MLYEYAITPEVLDPTEYPSEGECRLHLRHLKNALLQDSLVRNLRGGGWSNHIQENVNRWHEAGKELVKKLMQQGRLSSSKSCLPADPRDDSEWCKEAISSRKERPFHGIISGKDNAAQFAAEKDIASIHKLDSTSWWKSRSSSLTVRRTMEDYLMALNLILRHSNSLMLIDPHVDPSAPGYREIIRLFEAARQVRKQPLIEIHRVVYQGSGPHRRILTERQCRQCFEGLDRDMKARGIAAKVLVWDDFHDRFLISNVIGVMMSNGFDTTSNLNAEMVLARLGREDCDKRRREFDAACQRHELKWQFEIGA